MRPRFIHPLLRASQHGSDLTFAVCLLVLLAACGGQVTSGATPTPVSLAVILPSPTPLATFASQALTPVPTNTPAPTPTPVIHIVEPGETLLGIALQYGVTLDALQQVNGVLRPETLQIGTPLIIPSGSASSTSNAGGSVLYPTPAPLPISVEHDARFQTPVGSVWVLGEVANPGNAPLENVQVRVALLNKDGVEVANHTTFTVLQAVPGQGRSPFSVLFEDPPPDVAGFQAMVVRADPSYNYDTRYARLQVVDPQIKQAGSEYRVTGTVANSGPTNAIDVQVVVTMYDKAHHVTGYRQLAIPDGQLPAGASVPLEMIVSPDPSAPAVADFAVVAQARVGQ